MFFLPDLTGLFVHFLLVLKIYSEKDDDKAGEAGGGDDAKGEETEGGGDTKKKGEGRKRKQKDVQLDNLWEDLSSDFTKKPRSKGRKSVSRKPSLLLL